MSEISIPQSEINPPPQETAAPATPNTEASKIPFGPPIPDQESSQPVVTPEIPENAPVDTTSSSETAAPPVEEPEQLDASAAEATTEAKEKIIDQARQQDEINFVADASVNGRAKEALRKKEKGEKLTDQEKSLVDLHAVSNAKDGDRLTFGDGTPTQVTVDGKVYTIKAVNQIKGDTFICTANDGNIGRDNISFSREQVVNAQRIAEADNLRSGMSPAEQKAFDLQTEILAKGEAALDGKDPDEVNKTITEAANERGLFTTDTIQTIVDMHVAEGQLTPEKAALIGEILSEGNVLDQEEATKTLELLGVTDSVKAEIQAAQQQYAEADATLRHSPGDTLARQKFTEAGNALKAMKDFHPEKVIPEAMQGLYAGTIPPEAARTIRDALASGSIKDAQDALQSLIEQKGGAEGNPELQKLLKRSGSTAGMLWLLAYYTLKEAYKEIK